MAIRYHITLPNPETARNPVPVKNPIQWWSQWCDPYMGVEGI